METALAILPATLADVPALTALINQAYRGEASRQSWTTEAHLFAGPRISEAAVAKMAWSAAGTATRKPLGTLLKYLDANAALAGCVYLHPRGRRLYLSTLAVAPAAQAQGIGQRLLLAAEHYARAQSCTRINISVLSARPELLAWYERHGYQRTGQREPFPDTTDFGQPRQPLVLLALAKIVAA